MPRKAQEGMEEKILDYIKEYTDTNGYPPSVREIGKGVGIKSTSTVHRYISIMNEKGIISRNSSKTRALKLSCNVAAEPQYNENNLIEVPVLGDVAAGVPITAEQNVIDTFPLPSYFARSGEVFMLRVRGDSMINIGIFSGDYVIVLKQQTASNHEVVVAMIDGEVTVKRFYKEEGYFKLVPENDMMEPIIVPQLDIIGKVVGVFRTRVI